MAGLNLNPNPYVLVTQAGFFLASMYSIKKLMVEPYLKVKGKRDDLTTGNKSQADSILSSNNSKASEIESRLSSSLDESRKEVGEIYAKGASESDSILQAASNETSAYLEKVDRELNQDFAESRSQLPGIIKEITDICFDKVVQ